MCPTVRCWSVYFSDFLSWHLYRLAPDMDASSVPVVAVVALTLCILGWFQRLGKDSGKEMTLVIYLR